MKKRKSFVNLHLYFTVLVMIDFVATILLAWVIALVMEWLGMPLDLSPFATVILLGTFVGASITLLLGQLFLWPIKRLNRAMNRVAAGDFSVSLRESSCVREVQELCSNFNQMTKALAATEILQSDFVSNVSHEFKTPINAIEGYAMLLQNGSKSQEEQEKYVERILLSTRRLSNLVGNILLLSKVENQTFATSRERYRLDEQIRQSIVLLESKWLEKDIEFDVELDEVVYTGNEGLMMHVWNNLIGNAIKFDRPGGFIGIRLERVEDGCVFTVEDDGPGIPAENIDHVFDKFYQSDSSHKQEGNGLGLALVKRIVDGAGGTVAVCNRDGGGCRFSVKLPNT